MKTKVPKLTLKVKNVKKLNTKELNKVVGGMLGTTGTCGFSPYYAYC